MPLTTSTLLGIKEIPVNKLYEILIDVNILTAQLLYFFNEAYVSIDAKEYNDKKFIEAIKVLLKDKENCLKFIELVELDMKSFIKLLIYISPSIFTSNIIKFIQKTYL